MSSLIFATAADAPGYVFAIALSPCTTSSIIFVPCWIAGDGVAGAGDADWGEVGFAGPCCDWAEESPPASGGGGMSEDEGDDIH
jgi:hypothetical protein